MCVEAEPLEAEHDRAVECRIDDHLVHDVRCTWCKRCAPAVRCGDDMSARRQARRREGRLVVALYSGERHRRLVGAIYCERDRAGRRTCSSGGDRCGQRDRCTGQRRIGRGNYRGRSRRLRCRDRQFADLVGTRVEEPEVAVGSTNDVGGAAVGCRNRNSGETIRRRTERLRSDWHLFR